MPHLQPIPLNTPPQGPRLRQPRLWVDNRVPTLRRLHEIRVLLLEDGEVPLGLPVPDTIRSEEEVHFLERALVGLWVEGPDHGNGDDVAGGEDVEGLFVEGLEHDGAKEGLWIILSVYTRRLLL